MPTDWRLRGRQVYALHPMPLSAPLDLDAAMRLALGALVREIARVPELERDLAIDESAQGYFDAHREAGGSLTGVPLAYPRPWREPDDGS